MPSNEQPLPKRRSMTFRHPLQVGLFCGPCLHMPVMQAVCCGCLYRLEAHCMCLCEVAPLATSITVPGHHRHVQLSSNRQAEYARVKCYLQLHELRKLIL